MRKIVFLLIATVFCLSSCDNSLDTDVVDGLPEITLEMEGADSVCVLSSADDLRTFSTLVNCGYYYLDARITKDINLSNQAWTPIGNTSAYRGNFDGGGHTVSGLKVESTDSYQGLFSEVYTGAVVKNLNVEGELSGFNYVGGIAGLSSGQIINCSSSCTLSGNSYVGGIVGKAASTTSILNCYNSGEVSGDDFVGGIAGYVYCDFISGDYVVNLENCYNVGSVYGVLNGNYIGGISGFAYSAKDCYSLEGASALLIGNYEDDYFTVDNVVTLSDDDMKGSDVLLGYLNTGAQGLGACSWKRSSGAYPEFDF